MNKIIIYWTAYQTYPLQKVDPKKLDEKTEKVIDAKEHIKANNIIETNNLLQAANTQVVKQLGLKMPKKEQKNDHFSRKKR